MAFLTSSVLSSTWANGLGIWTPCFRGKKRGTPRTHADSHEPNVRARWSPSRVAPTDSALRESRVTTRQSCQRVSGGWRTRAAPGARPARATRRWTGPGAPSRPAELFPNPQPRAARHDFLWTYEFPFPPRNEAAESQKTRGLGSTSVDSGPGRLFGIHAWDATLTVEMPERPVHGRRAQRGRNREARARPARAPNGNRQRRGLRQERRRRSHAQSRPGPQRVSLDVLGGRSDGPGDRGERAYLRRRGALLARGREQREEQGEDTHPAWSAADGPLAPTEAGQRRGAHAHAHDRYQARPAASRKAEIRLGSRWPACRPRSSPVTWCRPRE